MIINDCKRNEISELLDFIELKSQFDKKMQGFDGKITTNESKINKTLFSDNPYAFARFIEIKHTKIGFGIFYYRYSSFKGQPSIWLEDLLIKENYRGKKAGAYFMTYLIEVAKSKNCSHIGWTASINNKRGIKFYEKLGANQTGQIGNSIFFRLEV